MSESAKSASEFGRRVAELRKARGLSRKELAAAIGMRSESGINEIENGRNFAQYERLGNLARVLGTTPDALLGFAAEPIADQTDQLDMALSAVQKMLMDEDPTHWPRERAEALTDIATEVALEKSELDLDRRLAAAFRRRALKPQP